MPTLLPPDSIIIQGQTLHNSQHLILRMKLTKASSSGLASYSVGESGLLGVQFLSPRIDYSTFHKPIRSYVRREGRITRAQHRALQMFWPKYGISNHASLLTSIELFGDERPLILEIGFGNGQNLVDLALAHPNQGYIGVDVYRPGVGQLMLALDRLQINNVRIFLNDAAEIFLHRFAECSLDSVLIYFPDPWPKKRHHKRRLLDSEFLDVLADSLKLGGLLHVATDWDDYANQILTGIDRHPGLVNQAGVGRFSERPDHRPKTKYELRGLRLGHTVHDILARRSP